MSRWSVAFSLSLTLVCPILAVSLLAQRSAAQQHAAEFQVGDQIELTWAGEPVTGVSVQHAKRKAGKSGFTLAKQIRLFSNLIINNSSLLMRLVGYTGILFSFLSLCYGAYIVFEKLVFGIGMVGWPSLIATNLLIGGLMLLSIGVVGEYLIRIIDATETKPLYCVRRRCEKRDVADHPSAALNRSSA